MVFGNNAAVAADGTVFFSDSSTQHGIEHWKKDFVEDTRTGRLPRLDPDGTVTVVQDGLAFANGVVLAADESFVERLQRGPKWLRRHVTRIPQRLQPKPRHTVRVQAYDDAGALVRDVSIDTPDFHLVTGVREHAGRLWLGSLEEPAVAVVDVDV